MAGIASEQSGVGRSLEGVSGGQQDCQSGEALAEWRSSEQVENGIPSTSPPYWDSDDDDDCGSKPPELYGKYTWKIDKFSQINKRELRSNAFEVGGYKWYILIYPQGCDVCNHLSLFLCVANHDKLLPGWSHFAQFTIAVVNKDPKKSKYSDTLHRFWKKEHDWGWKKFMELSKVLDGFIDADTLIIKAQVQVIRERADRPFRCLDCQYRRELVRVYLTNVEQICRRFVEERRGKLGKLIEDKARWTSFCGFWIGMDQNSRRRMSWEKTDSILKVVVKHFFIEKEVTSTLVMDSLYSGLKALEGQTKSKKGRGKHSDSEEQPVPIIRLEKDTFVLVDDVLLLLERAAMEPLPPKDEKGPQNRTKEGSSGEDFNKDSIERDERRLTELGRRTIEIFVLAHIFSSKIEVAYQEAVALKRQEELIREEEAAWMAGSEQKTKRGAADKEKKSKKKQGKHRKNNRRGKDKGRDEKPCLTVEDKPELESPTDNVKFFSTLDAESVLEKSDMLDDVSDVSDSVDCVPETLQADSEDRDASPVNWDADTSETHPSIHASSSGINGVSAVQNGGGKKSQSPMDDSSSTCSTDSAPSWGMNGSYRGNPPNHKNQKSSSRAHNQRGKSTNDTNFSAGDLYNKPSESVSDAIPVNEVSGSCNTAESESQGVILPLQDEGKRLEQRLMKEQVIVDMQRKLCTKDEADLQKSSPKMETRLPSPPRSPPKNLPLAVQLKLEPKSYATSVPVSIKNPPSESPRQADKIAPVISVETTTSSKSDPLKAASSQLNGKFIPQVPVSTEKPTALHVPVTIENPIIQQVPVVTEMPTAQHVAVVTEKPTAQQAPVTSRPLSAPLNLARKPNAPVVSMVQSAPLLSRSVSAAGRLGPDPSPATHSYVPQSYRNAMMGNPVTANSAGFTQPHPPNSAVNSSQTYMQPPTRLSAPMFLQQSPERMEPTSIRPGFSFGMVNHDMLHNGLQWMQSPQMDSNKSMHCDPSALLNDIQNIDLYKPVHNRSQDRFPTEFPACSSGRQGHGALADEFPHLDIINDLLDDEHAIGKVNMASPSFQSFSNGPHHLNRHLSFPGDMGMSSDMGPSTSSCRFERSRSYQDDGFQHNYGSSGNHFEPMRDMVPPANAQPYMNGYIDGLIPSQWQIPASDMPFLGMRNTGNDYPYHIPEYSNLACGVDGYTVFRPSNGH